MQLRMSVFSFCIALILIQLLAAGESHKSLVPGWTDFDSSASEMRKVIERYDADHGSLERVCDIPSSSIRRERMRELYSDWLAALPRMDFDRMSQDGQIDYILFKNFLEHQLRQLDIRAKTLSETEPFIPFGQTIIGLEEARQRMDPLDPAKTAATLNELSKQIRNSQQKIESARATDTETKVKKTVANRAVLQINNLKTILRNWYSFYNGYDPLFTWWVTEPYKVVDQTLQEYATVLRDRVVGVRVDDTTAIIGDPIGRDAILSELSYEMIPYTPEELIDIANRELSWCNDQMMRASREMGLGDDWRKALERVKTEYVDPGKQPQLIRQLALEAIKFIDDQDLVTIPQLARETWRMEMMSPERQLLSPFFTGGETITVSYPTNSMSHEAKMMSMRGNNIHFSRATVQHELIPGHHLQSFMADRFKPYRDLFHTPFSLEGWALYWELLLWDQGFAKSPQDRIGMLFWRMHRCARIIFSLSFHLEKMTPQECVDFLIQRVGHEPANAIAEVRRSFGGGYAPLYQSAYLLGGLQFRALHHEMVDSGKVNNRAFHDAILRENIIPVEMVRASLTRQKLSRDFTSSWKFYRNGI